MKRGDRPVLWLRVEAPLASFANPYARETGDTFMFPPPATVYGMLLSLVGEMRRDVYRDVELAVGMIEIPAVSTVFRKIRRFKSIHPEDKENSRPDMTPILTSVHVLVGLRDGESQHSLVQAVREALHRPERVNRSGGLSLGESHHLLNSVSMVPEEDAEHKKTRHFTFSQVWWLSAARESDGAAALPVQGVPVPLWVDHVGSEGTRFVQASFLPASAFETLRELEADNRYFFRICP